MRELTRDRASLYHLLISVFVFLVPAYLILYEWYPDLLFAIDGGWQGLRILALVHLIVGPLLTFIVFKTGKPGLLPDLAFIGALQIVCLIAGSWVIYKERPLFFVYYERSFYTVNAATFERFDSAPPGADQLAGKRPVYAIASVPADPLEEAALREELFKAEIPLWAHGPSYAGFEENLDKIIAEGYSFDDFQDLNGSGGLTIWLAQRGARSEEFAVYPVLSRYGNPLIAIHKRDRNIAGILNVDVERPEPAL